MLLVLFTKVPFFAQYLWGCEQLPVRKFGQDFFGCVTGLTIASSA
jgi:hypothetical protein